MPIRQVEQRQALLCAQADDAGRFIAGDLDLASLAGAEFSGSLQGDQRLIVRLTWQSMDLDHVPHIQQKHKNFYSRYINSRLEVQNYSQNT